MPRDWLNEEEHAELERTAPLLHLEAWLLGIAFVLGMVSTVCEVLR